MLYHIPPMEGSAVDLVFVPEEVTSEVIPDAPIDGCWRLDAASPEEAASEAIRIRPSPIPRELGPDERYAIRHEVYHLIDSTTCFPDGEYTTEKTLQFTETTETGVVNREGPKFTLRYTLTAEDDGSVSIDVNRP